MTRIVKQKILSKPDRILKKTEKNRFQNPLQSNLFCMQNPDKKIIAPLTDKTKTL